MSNYVRLSIHNVKSGQTLYTYQCMSDSLYIMPSHVRLPVHNDKPCQDLSIHNENSCQTPYIMRIHVRPFLYMSQQSTLHKGLRKTTMFVPFLILQDCTGTYVIRMY